MTTDADLDDLLAVLPLKLPREVYDEIEAARRAAELAPPPEATIIPVPEYPYRWPHQLAGTVRYPCALGCGWWHDEDTWAWRPGPIVFHTGDPGGLHRAIAEDADRRAAALRSRIESAIHAHFLEAHPGQEPPQRTI
ncbi:hypothetical protein ABT255_03640 [Streptomyces mirabilis]|uniref:hypothetical protein n=1 Tax=Streptomyces mirabilis TaxID=68239 RepID=UPI00331E39F6